MALIAAPLITHDVNMLLLLLLLPDDSMLHLYSNSVFFFLFLYFSFRHFLQHHPETENTFLHGQFDHSVRGHLVSIGPDFLPAGRLW